MESPKRLLRKIKIYFSYGPKDVPFMELLGSVVAGEDGTVVVFSEHMCVVVEPPEDLFKDDE